MRLRLRTTLYWLSGDWPVLEDVVEGGVGVMVIGGAIPVVQSVTI
jgi:hypothetical protein